MEIPSGATAAFVASTAPGSCNCDVSIRRSTEPAITHFLSHAAVDVRSAGTPARGEIRLPKRAVADPPAAMPCAANEPDLHSREFLLTLSSAPAHEFALYVQQRDEHGCTPLHRVASFIRAAARRGDMHEVRNGVRLINALIDAGAQVVQDAKGRTPWHILQELPPGSLVCQQLEPTRDRLGQMLPYEASALPLEVILEVIRYLEPQDLHVLLRNDTLLWLSQAEPVQNLLKASNAAQTIVALCARSVGANRTLAHEFRDLLEPLSESTRHLALGAIGGTLPQVPPGQLRDVFEVFADGMLGLRDLQPVMPSVGPLVKIGLRTFASHAQDSYPLTDLRLLVEDFPYRLAKMCYELALALKLVPDGVQRAQDAVVQAQALGMDGLYQRVKAFHVIKMQLTLCYEIETGLVSADELKALVADAARHVGMVNGDPLVSVLDLQSNVCKFRLQGMPMPERAMFIESYLQGMIRLYTLRPGEIGVATEALVAVRQAIEQIRASGQLTPDLSRTYIDMVDMVERCDARNHLDFA